MTLFVAELCVNHLGSLNLAMKMIEVAAEIGCDFVKLHRKDVDSFYTTEKLAQPYDSPFGYSWGEYRRMFEFSEDDFRRIDAKCDEVGIGWFATAQDLASLEFLVQFDLPLYKIASCNARNEDLVRAVAEMTDPDAPIVLSVGGSTLNEIGHALSWLEGRYVYLLHCVAEYPCHDSRLRLGNISVLKGLFEDDKIKVGFSSHEVGTKATYAALNMGIAMLERHFALSRHSFVHGIECAIEPDEYTQVMARYRLAAVLELDKYAEGLPREAMESSFGMSDLEHDFLVDQKYGIKFIPDKAHFDGQR